MEDEKARLFEFWQLNLDRAKGEAGELFAERSKRKGKWSEWAEGEVGGSARRSCKTWYGESWPDWSVKASEECEIVLLPDRQLPAGSSLCPN